jgi:uncharacterized SAM-binding protein YcdF (DUF218 family)
MRKFLIGAAIIALGLYLAREPILGAIGSYLVQAQPPQKADIVVVLAGDSSGTRIRTAAELVKEGYAPKILVSGPESYYGQHECEFEIPFAVKAGYPESYFIHAENRAHSTREEAQFMVAELRRMGVRRMLLVTSNYHTRRATRMYHQEAPEIQIITVAAPDAEFSPDGWWRTREGRKVALFEWMKTIAAWFNI